MQGKTSEAAPTIGVVSGRRKDGAPHPTCQRGEEEGAIFQLPTVFPSAFKAVGGRMNRQSIEDSQGSETTLFDTKMMDSCHYRVSQVAQW